MRSVIIQYNVQIKMYSHFIFAVHTKRTNTHFRRANILEFYKYGRRRYDEIRQQYDIHTKYNKYDVSGTICGGRKYH